MIEYIVVYLKSGRGIDVFFRTRKHIVAVFNVTGVRGRCNSAGRAFWNKRLTAFVPTRGMTKCCFQQFDDGGCFEITGQHDVCSFRMVPFVQKCHHVLRRKFGNGVY